ncbi:MAG: response regulator [Bacteroidetes bacterium]|nr:response regulator [Bacteroidota bacterium]
MENKKVLIVEDDSVLSLFYRSLLKRMGYQVCAVVANSDLVEEKLRETSPDFIMMDVKIAGNLDGIDTARKVRETHHLPIIFSTGNSELATMQRAREISNSEYLIKPIMEADLRIAFEKFMIGA